MNPQTITIIIFAVVFLLLLKENSSKKIQKAIGAVVITIGILLIIPIPDISDFIIFPIFSTKLYGFESVKSLSSLKGDIVNYLIFTFLVGAGLILLGLWISGYHPRVVVNKIKKLI